jgi:predicted RNase H-like HicB family nuclease
LQFFEAVSRLEIMTALRIEIDREVDGRWMADVPELPGVGVYGATREEAIAKVKVLALQVLVDKLAHGEPVPVDLDPFVVVAA